MLLRIAAELNIAGSGFINGAFGLSGELTLGPSATAAERGGDFEDLGRAELRRDQEDPEGSGRHCEVENQPRPGGAGKNPSETEVEFEGIFGLRGMINCHSQGDRFLAWTADFLAGLGGVSL